MTNLFVVAPYFPPSSLPPSQRARMMINHMHKIGFHPIVFTTHPKYREEQGDEWMNDLLTGSHEKIEIKAISQRITRKFGIGDLGLRILPFLFISLIRAKRKKPSFIIYLVPPWYLMLIAPMVKWITGIPYAIDFIDPWVKGVLPKNANRKARWSQRIAKKMEGWVTRNAAYIYAVSDPINQNLLKRHPTLKGKPFRAIPYGVEVSDYDQGHFDSLKKNELTTIRYIGAVWKDSYPVLEAILQVFGDLKNEHSFKLEFIGTSYVNRELAKSQLGSFAEKFDLTEVIVEVPDRRPYKEAMMLTLQADIMLLFGDMSTQYAASKLMGLIASKKPILAFLHRDTHPYRFLKDFDYPFLVGYSAKAGDLPTDNLEILKQVTQNLLQNYRQFNPIDVNDDRFRKHTAEGMTREIMEPIENFIKEYDKSHQ